MVTHTTYMGHRTSQAQTFASLSTLSSEPVKRWLCGGLFESGWLCGGLFESGWLCGQLCGLESTSNLLYFIKSTSHLQFSPSSLPSPNHNQSPHHSSPLKHQCHSHRGFPHAPHQLQKDLHPRADLRWELA